LLTSLPGIGLIPAHVIRVEIGRRPRAFQTGGVVVRSLGTPRQKNGQFPLDAAPLTSVHSRLLR